MIREKFTRISLDQWRILQAVVDCGGYSKAAEHLQKSQSTLSYALQKLQEDLGVTVLEIRGRKATLTAAGETLLRRARHLLEEAQALETAAASLSRGWESQITLNVDVICPQLLLLNCLRQFEQEHPQVRLDIIESALSGTQDAIVQGQADLALSGVTPPGFLGTDISSITMQCVAHCGHPLASLTTVHEQDLQAHRQIVVRDSGAYRRINAGWLGADKRWTVNNFSSSVELLRAGLGFAWVPVDHLQPWLERGELVPLPLTSGATRSVTLSLFYPNRERTGPAARYLGELLQAEARRLQSNG
jgi:DNA-binding transcriptional LysR family regulator